MATPQEQQAARVNPTAKERFMVSSKLVTGHRNMVSSDQFMLSSDYALLEYFRKLQIEKDPGAAHFKSVGAQEFLATFRSLAESRNSPEQKPIGNLDHHV